MSTLEIILQIGEILLTGGVAAGLVKLLLFNREKELKKELADHEAALENKNAEYLKRLEFILQEQKEGDEFKKRVLEELLAPLYMSFVKTGKALELYKPKNKYTETEMLKHGNETILNILLHKAYLIPTHLLEDAENLISHYLVWLHEYHEQRENPENANPSPFVFTFNFPVNAKVNFKKAFHEYREKLYGVKNVGDSADQLKA
ncbi:hypothetical protein DYD21_11715 [Rhodohalobacter sp. SW132]|uniref:hypothetical protein n=1 Tax=Rhodohalobacter sp. SW132 TaxID=2293433 RepID=UPI000E275FD5|nr:hypothetical protein [Rhodohalobacter sp. SW132]REL33432.1 hypothetical protein DYD21_11715 [Rhodohalobacter sp. SW132]